MEGSYAQLLGQQQLLETAPTRRLIVHRGHLAHWGCDPSTLRVALAGVSRASDGSLDRWVQTQPFAPVEGPARLSEIYAQTQQLAFRLGERSRETGWPAPPGLVLVEQPSGKQDNPALSYAVGVIQAAIYDGLFSAFGVPVRIETVTSSHWKLVACGRGNLYKPTKKKLGRPPVFEDYEVAVWARANGYAGSSWDEADAWGIAESARREVALEER